MNPVIQGKDEAGSCSRVRGSDGSISPLCGWDQTVDGGGA